MNKSRFLFAPVSLLLLLASTVTSEPPQKPCGLGPSDWCVSENDPCWVHKDKAACQADPTCEGLPYRGESVVACQFDKRCFASNCPSVGCVTPCASLTKKRCEEEKSHCKWDKDKCAAITVCG